MVSLVMDSDALTPTVNGHSAFKFSVSGARILGMPHSMLRCSAFLHLYGIELIQYIRHSYVVSARY